MRHGRQAGWILLLVWAALTVHAGEPLPVSVYGPDTAVSHQFTERLIAEGGSLLRLVDGPEANVVLALGQDHFEQALRRHSDKTVLGIHVSAARLHAARLAGCRCSGVYREAPLASQIRILRELMPGASRVGVLIGPYSAHFRSDLVYPGLLFDVRTVTSRDGIASALNDLLPRVDVLLAVADGDLYNAETARLILLASYRQRRPVMGPDEAFVRAGSLAAVHPTADTLMPAVMTLLAALQAGDALPDPVYASVVVTVNAHVARSYGVLVPDPGVLEKILEKN
jgi:putative tryptophan/tyrosine transport system substrate-binding protein